MQNFDHKIGFREKLSKIAENWDHNIDPRARPNIILSMHCVLQLKQEQAFALWLNGAHSRASE
jgi:pterin-4a-carbinolamine dehydratase